ncbi:MAG: radical SAM protein [Pseudobacteriovorax sp.]|nr:radical SAM protein [Pseudobacteriovorax sp.]
MKPSPQPLCKAPFVQLLLAPNGNIHPCCYHFGYKLGTFRDSFDSIWNGKRIEKLRKELIDHSPKICKSRIHNLQCHKNFEHFPVPTGLKPVFRDNIQKIDIRLNGHCNLSCIMCDVWQQPNNLYNDSFFWNEGPEKIFPFIKEVEILGGEPLIQRDTYKFINAMIVINPDCQFSFVTNGSFPISKTLKSTLSKIKLRRIQISIDAVTNDTYDQIRKGGVFSLVIDTLEYFESLRETELPDLKLVASMCVVKQNFHEIEDFLKMCFQRRIEPELQFAFYDPSNKSSLLLWSKEEKKEALVKLSTLPNTYNTYLEEIKRPLLRSLESS